MLAGAGAGVLTAGLVAAVPALLRRAPAASPDPVRALVPMLRQPITSIPDVARRLAAVRDHMGSVGERGAEDGIACFSRLYTIITETVDARPFADRAFLVRLDIEFARRYFAALLAYARDPATAPGCWRLLFDRRSDASVTPARFAAAGVNAHINYDLAAALLATWPLFPPSEPRRDDYDGINDVFAQRMEGLRDLFDSPLAHAAPIVDRNANGLGDLLVRSTRTVAWDLAGQVWTAPDRAAAARTLDRELDRVATLVGTALLESPALPL